jgi:predicted DNA-binding transcriptional regulator AlpA
METIPQLLNYKTLREFYGLCRPTIARLVMEKKFTDVVKIGRKNYFRREDVEAWIDSRTIKVGGK